MIETCIAQISVDVHFNLSTEETRHKVQQTLHNDHDNITDCKDHNRIQCMQCDEMIQCILIEQWIYRVNHRRQQCRNNHPYECSFMFFQIWKNTWNSKQRQLYIISAFFFAHACTSCPISLDCRSCIFR